MADVSASAEVGEGTMIWEFARVREDAVVGKECIIGRGAYVDTGVRIGDRVKIQNNALVYHGVSVAAGVFIGPAAVLTNDRTPRSVTLDGELARGDDWRISTIDLAEGCSIGAQAVVVAGCDVGRFAMVGAGSIVTKSVPDHAVVVGNPAQAMGWVCACGHRLVDDSSRPVTSSHAGEAQCPEDQSRYVVRDGRCRRVVPA